MSKYNSFAVRLDLAFKRAKEKYEAVLQEFETAKKNNENAQQWQPETYVGENESRRVLANAKFQEATAKMNDAKKTIWQKFESETMMLSAELEKAVKADGLLSPSAIDSNALELLKSGVMDSDDYMKMLTDFDGNPTMLRLLSKYAADAYQNEKLSVNERATLLHVANEARNGRSEIMRSWDELVGVALTCAGIRSIGRGGYMTRMGEYWESEGVQAYIEGF